MRPAEPFFLSYVIKLPRQPRTTPEASIIQLEYMLEFHTLQTMRRLRLCEVKFHCITGMTLQENGSFTLSCWQYRFLRRLCALTLLALFGCGQSRRIVNGLRIYETCHLNCLTFLIYSIGYLNLLADYRCYRSLSGLTAPTCRCLVFYATECSTLSWKDCAPTTSCIRKEAGRNRPSGCERYARSRPACIDFK